MNLALITLCQSKINIPEINQPLNIPTQEINNRKLSAYQINVLAALGELSLGLPLDRIKVGLQSGSTYREIFKQNMASSGQIPGTQTRSPKFGSPRNIWPHRFYTNINLSYWFAGHTPSIINRCFIYLPGIAYFNTGYSKHIEPWVCWAGGCPKLASQAIVKPILVSALISPYVALFEGLKLTQQLGIQRVYPREIHKFIGSQTTGYPSTTPPVSPTTYQLIRGVISSRRSEILFASFWPTFARETAFISGMCVIQPLATQYLINSETMNNKESARVLGSLIASFACQTISQPFDVLKTRRECQPSNKWSQIIEHLKIDIKNKGARTVLFAGWLPRCIRGVWTFYSVSAIRDCLNKYNSK